MTRLLTGKGRAHWTHRHTGQHRFGFSRLMRPVGVPGDCLAVSGGLR